MEARRDADKLFFASITTIKQTFLDMYVFLTGEEG